MSNLNFSWHEKIKLKSFYIKKFLSFLIILISEIHETINVELKLVKAYYSFYLVKDFQAIQAFVLAESPRMSVIVP